MSTGVSREGNYDLTREIQCILDHVVLKIFDIQSAVDHSDEEGMLFGHLYEVSCRIPESLSHRLVVVF